MKYTQNRYDVFIDGNLDQLFKIESLGITDNFVSNLDQVMIDDFKSKKYA